MKKLLWMAAAGLCVLSACQSNVATRRGELLVLDVPADRNDDPEDMAKMFKMRNYVILETNDSSIFNRPDEIVRYKGDFYILDSRNTAIIRFGEDGRFIHKYYHKGNGPGEYMRPNDIAISGDTLWILDSNGYMHGYSLDDEHLTTGKAPKALSMKMLEPGVAYHTGIFPRNDTTYRYTFIKNSGDTVRKVPYSRYIASHSFSFGRGSVIFSDCGGPDVLATFPLNDTLYVIDKANGNISPLAVINLGMNRTVPLDAAKEEARAMLDDRNIPKTIFSVHNWGDALMFDYDPGERKGFATVIVDLPSGEILYKGRGSFGSGNMPYQPFVYSSDSKDHPLMTLVNSDMILRYADNFSAEDQPLVHEIAAQLEEEANPVVVFYDYVGPKD